MVTTQEVEGLLKEALRDMLGERESRRQEPPKITAMNRRFQVKCLLASVAKRTILVPTQEEWIGVNLLELDGDLPRIQASRKLL